MLQKVLHQLQGEIRAQIVTEYPERIFNLCGEWHIAFWDVQWRTPTEFTCRLSRRDWNRLRKAAQHMDCIMRLEHSGGVPVLLRQFLHRPLLLVCLMGGMLAMFLGTFFIFDFEVTGNEAVSSEAILRALENNGISMGSFAFAIDSENLRNHVLLELPDLSWITVNVSGCRAHVEVRERVYPPEQVSREEPANLVARKDGLVLNIQPLSGTKCVLSGTTVEAGQILISGVEDTDSSGARLVTGLGSVIARTWYTLTARTALLTKTKVYTGEEDHCFSLVMGTNRIKFFQNSSESDTNYDTIYQRHRWSLLGVSLPITAVTETRRYYRAEPSERSAETAETAMEQILTEYLHTQVDPYGTVCSTLCSSKVEDGVLIVTLRAECEEEIGQTVPVYQD